MCDVAYVLLTDQIERRAVAAMTAGAEVDPDQLRADFDAALVEKIAAPVDREREELLRALGLRR